MTGQVDRPGVLVGRVHELAVLRSAVDSVSRHEGSVVWVEGEPGIGKTAIVAAVTDVTRATGMAVYWSTADQFSQRLPLRVMLDCLRVDAASPDPRRAAIADYVGNHRAGLLAMNDVVYAAAEMLLTLVDELCADAPVVLVVDDLHWSDDASLTVWHRLSLAARQLPLLLVGVSHPIPRLPIVQELRASVRRHGGTVLRVDPLSEAEVQTLVTNLVGTVPDELAPLVSGAVGNPLYLRDLLGAAGSENHLPVTPAVMDTTAGASDHLPRAVVAAITDRLTFLPPSGIEVLRAATLLGRAFAVADLAALLHRPVFAIASDLQEATSAGILADAQSQLSFRHPLIRQALYESMPAALRCALHQEVARTLAQAQAEPLVVAQQLVAAGQPAGGWARHWLVDVAPALAARAPEIAVNLIEKELNNPGLPGEDRSFLAVALTRTLLGQGRFAQAVRQARQAIAAADGPASRGEAQWLLARALSGLGNDDEAVQTIRLALEQGDLPTVWRARLLASRSIFERASTGDLAAADAAAEQALRTATAAADKFAIGYSLAALWLTDSVRRDHLRALERIDQALAAPGEGAENDDLRTFLLDCRIFSLQNLDRWSEAETTAALRARKLAQHTDAGRATSSVTAAALMYWLGRWDDALTELSLADNDPVDVTYAGLRERGPALLRHGVSALISAHRDDRPSAERCLRAGLALPRSTPAQRENSDFLVAAHALMAEQDGDPVRALDILSEMTVRLPGEMALTHQWLPDLVRLALAVGDEQAARAGLMACQAEAAAESTPARAAAANHRCVGLVNRDREHLRLAVAHYRTVGLPVELAGALEDLAEVLAEHGDIEEARTLLNEAVDRYSAVAASWDVRRAERRLRAHGIRRGVHGPRRPHPSFGWDALTFTEVKVATLVALGQSTPRIAEGMLVSRRTVQTHISHILNKLDARSRMEIAREALRRGVVAIDNAR